VHFESLHYLNLNSNNLKILPREIFNLVNLKKLYVDANKLTSLPIGRLLKLEYLEILSLDQNLFSDEEKALIEQKLNYWFGEV
jgi:Leucine-rich repeat (LRR) protein